MPKMLINLVKCPSCGTIYDGGIRGWGNCPTCSGHKTVTDNQTKVKIEDVK